MKLRSLLFFVAIAAVSVTAQSPTRILKQAEKALGGSKPIQAVRSITRTGTIRRHGDGAVGHFRSHYAKPNLFYLSYDLNRVETELAYNGRSGWLRNAVDIKTLTGQTITDLQARSQYRNNLWLNAKKEKSRLTSGGKTTIDGKPASVVILTTRKGATIKLYFDSTNGLLIRDEVPNDGLIEQTDYGDYRDVGGTKQAFFNRLTIDGAVHEIRFDEIKLNDPIARSVFDFPNPSGAPLPDIASLLKDVQANEDKVENILDTYSYVQKNIRRQVGKDGVLRETGSETFQLSFFKGYRISRMIEKNGRPLSASEQADQDKDAAERAGEIEERIAKRERRNETGPPSDESRRISIAEVLRASTLSNPRRERFRGRDVIVFDFEPNPAFDFNNAKSMLKFFGKTAGSMWIDEKDRQVARLEAYLADSYKIGGGVLAKLKKGATFTLEQERVNDEIWLPSTADINLSVRVLLVKGIDVNQLIRSYDYRKFTTEVKDAKVDAVKQ